MRKSISWNSWVYWNWQKYRQIHANECVNADGAWRCAYCKSENNPEIVAECTQFGFKEDMMTEFCECSDCHKRIAVVSLIPKEVQRA